MTVILIHDVLGNLIDKNTDEITIKLMMEIHHGFDPKFENICKKVCDLREITRKDPRELTERKNEIGRKFLVDFNALMRKPIRSSRAEELLYFTYTLFCAIYLNMSFYTPNRLHYFLRPFSHSRMFII